jgi:hypothetical protein
MVFIIWFNALLADPTQYLKLVISPGGIVPDLLSHCAMKIFRAGCPKRRPLRYAMRPNHPASHPWRPIACGTLALYVMSASSQSPLDDPWYTVDQVGTHVVNAGAAAESLSPSLARRYFAGNFLLNWTMPPDAERRRVRALAELIHQEPRLMTGGDPRPIAEVEKFSRSRAIVRVTLILGGFRWHHYTYQLARYEIARDAAVDAGLHLPELERRLSFSFHGLGYGSGEADLIARLGHPSVEYAGQAPSQRNLYYKRDDLHVEIHDGVVYYIEHGKPGWLQPMPPLGAGPAHGAAPPRR